MAWILSAVGVALFFSYFALIVIPHRGSVTPESSPLVFVIILSFVGFSLLAVLSKNIFAFFRSPAINSQLPPPDPDEEEDDLSDESDMEARAFQRALIIHDQF